MYFTSQNKDKTKITLKKVGGWEVLGDDWTAVIRETGKRELGGSDRKVDKET